MYSSKNYYKSCSFLNSTQPVFTKKKTIKTQAPKKIVIKEKIFKKYSRRIVNSFIYNLNGRAHRVVQRNRGGLEFLISFTPTSCELRNIKMSLKICLCGMTSIVRYAEPGEAFIGLVLHNIFQGFLVDMFVDEEKSEYDHNFQKRGMLN